MSGQFYSVLRAREPRIEHCGLVKRVESILFVLIHLGWSTEALQHDRQKVSKCDHQKKTLLYNNLFLFDQKC